MCENNFDLSKVTWCESTINPILRRVRHKQGVLTGIVTGGLFRQEAIFLDLLMSMVLGDGSVLKCLDVKAVHEILEPYILTTSNKRMRVIDFNNKESKVANSVLAVIKGSKDFNKRELLCIHELLLAKNHGKIIEAKSNQLDDFIEWFAGSYTSQKDDPLIRVALAYLWFRSIRPFEDGNKRMANAITYMAMIDAEEHSTRLSSNIVSHIVNEPSYTEEVNNALNGDMNITSWLEWFLEDLHSSLENDIEKFTKMINKMEFKRLLERKTRQIKKEREHK